MTTTEKAPIVIVGAGYVGLITAAGFAQAREVRLVEADPGRLASLQEGRVPISEPGLKGRLGEHRLHGRIRFFPDLDTALADDLPRLVFIAVGTPTREPQAGEANLDDVDAVIGELMGRDRVAAVMKSTVPPGTGHEVLERIRGEDSGLTYLSCPEFLQEGAAFEGFDNPDRIVVGLETPSWASQELRRLHAEVHPGLGSDPPYLEMDLTSAEMVKHASNLHLAMRVSYANQISNVCEELGADVSEVMTGVGADSRIGPHFLEPGVGFGGSCFGKDIRALRFVADEAGVDLSFADTVIAVNEEQARRTVRKLERHLGLLVDRHIAILGLAFKPETDDVRQSPAFAIARELRSRDATLRAWDPEPGARRCSAGAKAPLAGVSAGEDEERGAPAAEQSRLLAPEEVASSALDAIDGADAVVLVTAWPEFAAIDWREAANAMRGNLVVDGRNQLSPEGILAAGLKYEGTGRETRGVGLPPGPPAGA